jgi:DNA repair protein RecO (recombination protein O)
MERETMGIVIRTVDYNDNDKMVTLLTKDFGRMSARIRGCKKPACKLFSAASLFCCGDYLFFEKDGRYGVKGCAIRRTFFGLQGDYDAYTTACFIADAVDKVAQEDDVPSGLFTLTVNALFALDTGAAPVGIVLCYFLQRLLHIEGVYPSFAVCAACDAEPPLVKFSAEHGGALCQACARGIKGAFIDESFLNALRLLACTTAKDLGSLSITEDVQKRLSTALIAYLEYVLQHPLKTARFLNSGTKKDATSCDK